MKKLILSAMAMALLTFAANAVTYMRVHTSNGKIVKYDVEKVIEVYYGEIIKTPSQIIDGVTVSGKEGDYTYVDLGLPSGTKWATYNVGATKPTEYGGYFAWGETMPKEEYSWWNYKWGNGDEITKYGIDSDDDMVGNNSVLEADDDVATANWGSEWRMPTKIELEELLEGCDWEWVEGFNGSGVNGHLGISKTNEATIFLPAAGLRSSTNLLFAGSGGNYWLSSLSDMVYAYRLFFDNDYIYLDDTQRKDGMSVRAVLR